MDVPGSGAAPRRRTGRACLGGTSPDGVMSAPPGVSTIDHMQSAASAVSLLPDQAAPARYQGLAVCAAMAFVLSRRFCLRPVLPAAREDCLVRKAMDEGCARVVAGRHIGCLNRSDVDPAAASWQYAGFARSTLGRGSSRTFGPLSPDRLPAIQRALHTQRRRAMHCPATARSVEGARDGRTF